MTVVGWEPDAHIDQKARWQVGRAKRSGDIFFPEFQCTILKMSLSQSTHQRQREE